MTVVIKWLCTNLTNPITSALNSWVTMNRKIPMKEKTSICVIKILPNHIEQPRTGLVVALSGFSLENQLVNIMYKYPLSPNDCDSKTKVFLRDTGACEICFDAKIGCFLVKALFVPMEAPNMATDNQVKTYINSIFIPAFYNASCESDVFQKGEQFPLLKDNNQIYSVTNWSDAVHKQEDIVMLIHIVLKLKGLSFNDWIDCHQNNIYSLFGTGNIIPYTIARFNIPLEKLCLEDKINYVVFLVEQKLVDLRHDLAFLENIRRKMVLTQTEKRSFESILNQYNTKNDAQH